MSSSSGSAAAAEDEELQLARLLRSTFWRLGAFSAVASSASAAS